MDFLISFSICGIFGWMSLDGTRIATGVSPKSGQGTPITALSNTPGLSSKKTSNSFGYILYPPEIMRSLSRPTI